MPQSSVAIFSSGVAAAVYLANYPMPCESSEHIPVTIHASSVLGYTCLKCQCSAPEEVIAAGALMSDPSWNFTVQRGFRASEIARMQLRKVAQALVDSE